MSREISPATAKPWIRRRTTSSTGASTPTWAYVGRQPTSMVEMPIMNMHTSSTFLRPCVSPMWPSTKAPIGRAT